MKFSVGDPVYIKSNQEEGVILEIVDKNTAKVKSGKAIYHVFFEDLDHPYLNWFLNQNKLKKQSNLYIDNIQSEKKTNRQSVLPFGVYMVFFPQYKIDEFDEVIDRVKIYFYNETPKDFTFCYSAKNKNETFFEIENQLLPNSEFYIHDIAFENIANSPIFQYKFFETKQPALETESFITLKPKKLYDYIDKIKYDNHAFFSICLFDEIKPKPIETIIHDDINLKKISNKQDSHFNFSHILNKSKYEIDLHIEKLVKNAHKLGPSEKMNIQLKEFESALELASVTHQRSIVFIHGVGKGTLKEAIHKILSIKKQTKSIKTYVNNYDTRYGYGATEVFF
ncbi:MAG TPA: hypothetical protein PLZ98_04580 [Chitinophagaceae bacterium]|mgnify:FL=1|jgi:hypothetical protein|nr:Smr/MutS family protein [Bacteroidota bacterium]HQW46325.1 hypothetical protein [Chitinophagaceae bacterium]